MSSRARFRTAALLATLTAAPAPLIGWTVADTSRIITLPFTSRVYGNTRTVRVYLPPGYSHPENRTRHYPLLLMGDGFAVFSPRAWNAPAQLDSLIAGRAIAPLVLVGIDNAASISGIPNPGLARAREYLPYADLNEPLLSDPQGTRYPDMLWNEVLPLVRSRFRVDTVPDAVVLGGSSYSAIAALYTATVTGPRFDGLLLESPPVFMFQERLTDELLAATRLPRRLYIGIGTAETTDTAILNRGAGSIRRLIIAAEARRLTTRLNQVEGATHDSRAWRARLPAALRFLFPPDPDAVQQSGTGPPRPGPH
jgi:enterochelin esterase-like enzyme